MTRFHNHELLELLDTQKALENTLLRGDGEHIGECTGTVTEFGECGDPKKKNSKPEKCSLESKNKMNSEHGPVRISPPDVRLGQVMLQIYTRSSSHGQCMTIKG